MGFFTSIGAALGFGTTAATAGGITAFGAGVGATALAAGGTVAAMEGMKQPKMPDIPMPQAPKVEEAAKIAQDTTLQRKKAMARASSIFTSPMGVEEEALTAKKTILGR